MNAIATIPTFSMTDIERVALAIAKGGLFGSKDPNAVLTLCLLAQAEGQHPAVVFRDYHIINGKPAKKAEAMLRDFITSGGKVEWHALTDDLADATFSHPQGGIVRIDWNMKRAQQAGISTPMWKKYPRQMLRSRVISEGVRSVCPSATSGLYEVDEVRDIVAETSNTVEAQFVELPTQEQAGGTTQEGTVSPPPAKREPQHSALKTAYRQFVHEANGCGDGDELVAFLATPDALKVVREVREKLPHIWDGSNWPEGTPRPEEWEPLADFITRRQRECAEATARYMTA